MARNKRPALTSPWKIGFLVSLLLVAVSIGVGYFITRSFNLTWSWIQFHGTWNEFTFNRDAFMSEMLMLVILVPLVALIGYLMITGAVRKYRRYLDSGLDYKRLIQSINSIHDLQNEAAIRKLTSHPELRNFLLTLRKNVMEREKALDAREAVLKDREGEKQGEQSMGAEVDVLVSAILSGHEGGFQRELAITVPELKRIEKAVRDLVAGAPSNDAEERLEALQGQLADSTAALRGKLDEIAGELKESEAGARELESEIASMRTQLAAGAPAGADNGAGAQRAIGHLDSIGTVLNTLGEETRAMAINTALHASSAGTSGETIIQLADGVRDVATKFGGVATQWAEASEEARQAFASGGAAGSGSVRAIESLETLSARVGRWVERAVVLSEKVRAFEQHFLDTFDGMGGVSTQPTAPSTAEDWGFEATSAAGPAPQPAGDDGDFETAGSRMVLGGGSEESDTSVNAEDFEKQQKLFSDTSEPEADGTEMFADIPDPVTAEQLPDIDTPETNTAEESPATAGPVGETPQAESEKQTPAAAPDPTPQIELESPADSFAPPAPPAAPAATDDAEAPNAPREYVIDEEPPAPPAVEREVIAGPNLGGGNPSSDTDTVEIERGNVAADVIDLYALGAVDYEPENVHHNA